MEVFVLTYLCDPANDESWVSVQGVFKSLDDARVKMGSNYKECYDSLGITSEELGNFTAAVDTGERECSIWLDGERHVWSITEEEL